MNRRSIQSSIILAIALLLIACESKKEQKESTAEMEVAEKEEAAPKYYELRTYYAADGKLADLLSRFRDHTTSLFEKHGAENIGYWVPSDNIDNKLVYILRFESPEQRQEAFQSFIQDPEWKKVAEESRRQGPLVDSIKNVFMYKAAFSPDLKMPKEGGVYELRKYYTHPGKLPNLHKRFEDHTIDLFEKQGMKNLIYFKLAEDQEGADSTLIYLLNHESMDKAKESWAGFRDDPNWKKAFEESRKNGPLVRKVVSEYLKPTDFSALK